MVEVASLIFVITPVCSADTPDSVQRSQIDREVLQIVTSTICGFKGKQYAVLYSEASSDDSNHHSRTIPDDLFNSLRERNRSPQPLPVGIGCNKLHMAEASAIDAALAKASPVNAKPGPSFGWEAFYSEFPGSNGVTYLSLPGYSVSFNEAVVYVAHTCGLMCGAGFYWHLRKVRDHWVVLEREGGWIA